MFITPGGAKPRGLFKASLLSGVVHSQRACPLKNLPSKFPGLSMPLVLGQHVARYIRT